MPGRGGGGGWAGLELTESEKIVDILILWFNFILGIHFISFCFSLIVIHYHTQKQMNIKFKTKDKTQWGEGTSL